MCAERAEQAAPAAIEGLCGGPDESLFQAHFERLPGPAYIWRGDGDDFTLIAYNRAAMERLRSKGLPIRPGITAKGLPDEDRIELLALMRQCANTNEVIRREVDIDYPVGGARRMVFTLIPISRDILVQHTEDITDRFVAEQALRASEARARALMAANPDMLMRISGDGVYLDAHIPPKISENMPFRAEQFIGRRVDELYEDDFARQHGHYRRKAIETGAMQSWEYWRPLAGKNHYIEARFMRSGDDEVVVAVTDVTDRVDLEREIINSVERERIHIGHDLHDGLGQLLTGVKLMLEPLRKKLPADASLDGRNLQHAVDLINQAIAQTSEIARGLSPVPREAGLTLNHALEQLAARSERLFGIKCTVSGDVPTEGMSDETLNNLYRIAQEAITNAVKHGKAHEVKIVCRVKARRLMMSIEDDGLGIRDAPAKGGGMGLPIMRYRARAFGGEVAIRPRQGGGTIVSCYCPLPGRWRLAETCAE